MAANTNKATKKSRWRETTLVLVLFALLGLGFSYRQQLTDWLRLRGYTPDQTVSSLAVSDGFTPRSTHLFYINRPVVVAKSGFTQRCSSQSEQTIVLGCYHGTQNGIYVLRISDDHRLDGVMQVTAAHEMLHAAYDRLGNTRRVQVDGWLTDYYKHGLQDERIKKTIDAYRASEPDALVNEMHSIFGTEVPSLPPKLEQYYAQYFTDRQRIVSYASSYQAAFVSRENSIDAYDQQLQTLKKTIETEENQLNTQIAALRTAQADMEDLKRNGQTGSYNGRVAQYNQMVAIYNQLVTQTKQNIGNYNQIVAKRNDIASEQQQLVKELSGDNLSTID